MRPEKFSMMEEIRGRVRDSKFFFLTNMVGTKVSADQQLRAQLREAQAEIHMVKNNMFRHVAKENGLEEIEEFLKGSTSLVTGTGDVTAVAKVLFEFAKGKEIQVIKVGALDGKPLSKADIDDLASLPPREILLSKLLATIQAPAQQLAGVINSAVAKLPRVLKAVEDKKAAAS